MHQVNALRERLAETRSQSGQLETYKQVREWGCARPLLLFSLTMLSLAASPISCMRCGCICLLKAYKFQRVSEGIMALNMAVGACPHCSTCILP